jgi:hypothetical protein
MFKEIIAVYSKNHTKPPKIQNADLLIAKRAGTYRHY